MILETELQEIRDMLQNAKKPLFIFDDDQDGLCSFILLWRLIEKGKGFPNKGQINEDIIRKIESERSDLIVILDKAVIKQEFIDSVHIPIIHIDHHPLLSTKGNHYHYYNPRKEDEEDDRPTSYWAYMVTKKDLWIAMVGIIGDWYIPEFLPEFQKQYPNLIIEAKHPGQVIFETEFGKLIRAFIFSLKGKATEKKQCIKVLTRIGSPNEILEQETPRGKFIWKHFLQMEKKYQQVSKQAQEIKPDGKIIFFTYPSIQDSFTSLISNEIIYKNPTKVIIIARIKNDSTIMSIRSTKINLPPIIQKSLEGLTGYGGGHDHACGANVKNEDFGTFMERFKKQIEESKT